MDVGKVAEIIHGATKDGLSGVDLDRVVVTEETGEGGDPVLDVQLVYDDRKGSPTGDQMLDAQIELQDALWRAGETRSPVVSFVARSEADQAA